MEQVQGYLAVPDLIFLTTHPAGIESRNKKEGKSHGFVRNMPQSTYIKAWAHFTLGLGTLNSHIVLAG